MRATTVSLLLAACLLLGAAQAAQSRPELDQIELEPVSHSRALLQAANTESSGAYGSQGNGYGYGYGAAGRRRFLLGGYGGYSNGYGYGAVTPRLLREMEQQEQEQEQEQQVASAVAAVERRAEQPREAAVDSAMQQQGEQQQQKQAEQGANAAMKAAMRSARAAAAGASMAIPVGQCYCRYDPDYNTWAIGEESCKQALYSKCKAGQVPCDWLDAYYSHTAGAMAHTLPHEQDILGFVFDDCQPHPPCACAGIKFDGSDSVTNSYACCRDLRAACRTPFDGLSCSDVDAFCKDDQPSAKLLSWAQHKLHRGAECLAYAGMPFDFVPFEKIVENSRRAQIAASELAAAPAPAAGGFGNNRVATAVVCLGGVMVAVALVGMVATLRAAGGGDASDIEEDDDTFEAPLLHPVPEVAHRNDSHGPGSLRHVVSSNYILASPPPSRSASAASLASAHQQ